MTMQLKAHFVREEQLEQLCVKERSLSWFHCPSLHFLAEACTLRAQ